MGWKKLRDRLRGSDAAGRGARVEAMPSPAPLIRSLEPRVMYDAAVAATAAEVTHVGMNDMHVTPTREAAPPAASDHRTAILTPATVEGQPVSTETGTGRNVLFVDARVQDTATLLAHVAAGTQVAYLQQGQDGLAQMAAWLGSHEAVDSVQILAHGNTGDLWLGSTYLDSANLSGHAQELAAIGHGIAQGGDILVYACNTAQGTQGVQFVDSLAALTGRDVAASSDRTGAGGDWVLEVSTGSIAARSVLSGTDEAAYQHDLAIITVTTNADSGAGSLRNAIASANSGDEITFSSAMTITLSSGQLTINKNLTVEGDLDGNGTPDVTIDANYTSRVISVTAGTVTLDGLTLKNGLVSGVGGHSGNAGVHQTAPGAAGGSALGAGVYIGAATVTMTHDVVTSNRAAGGGGGGAAYNGTGYGGGGGGGFSGKGGGQGGASYIYYGGSALTYAGKPGSGGTGGIGGYGPHSAASHSTPGQGGSTTGGAGGFYHQGGTQVFGDAGAGGTAGSIGGGGGGMGYGGSNAGAGGSAAAGIYIAGSGVLYLGSTTVSNNAAAGGGGGSTAVYSYAGFSATGHGGVGGAGTGGIAVAGHLHYESSTTTFSGNAAGGGGGGQGGNGTGTPVTAAAGAASVNTATFGSGVIDSTYVFNAAPVVANLNSDSVNFTEGGSAVVLDVGGNATVTDSDNANFSGGNLTVAITAGGTSSEDVLTIVNQGTGAGQIGVSGSDVTYGGVTIGTFTGGTAGSNLVISFNGSATPAAAQALVRDITYANSNGTQPSTSDRTVAFTVNDGSGGTSTAANVTVHVAGVNDAPTLSATGNSPTYTENGAGVTLFSGASVSTVESGQTIIALDMTVTNISDGSNEILHIDGTDVALTNGNAVTTATNGMSVSVSVVSGTATVTIGKGAGISSAAMATLVSGITYRDNGDAPTAGNRVATLTAIQDSGGTASGGVDTTTTAIASTVTVVAVNDAPVVTTDGGSAAFVAGDNTTSTPVAIDSGLTVTDVDNTTLAGATVAITGNFHSGEDVLAFTNDSATMGNITASYNSGTGVLTLTSAGGTATLAQWQAALRSVTYTDTAVTPNSATRTISFTANDGALDSTAATRTVTVTPTDQTPILGTSGGSTAFTEGNNTASTPVVVDAGLTVSDLDNTTLSSATVSLSGGFQSGQDVLSFTNNNSTTMGNIVASYNSGTGVLTLTSAGGTATLAQWQNALRSVTYTNASDTPDTGNRTVSFAVSDGTKVSAAGTKTVTVASVDDTPIATTSGGAASWVEGNNVASTPVAVDGGFTVSDADNTTLASATVAVTGNFQSGQDVLAFTNDGATMGNIVASYNATTGVLTLTSAGSTATLAQWQAALRSVTYTDTSDTPATATRTISFVVNDGTVNSATVTRAVTVTSTDDTPLVTTSGGSASFVEGRNVTSTPVAVDAGLTLSDLDNTTLVSATVTISGNFQGGEDGLSFINDGATMGNIAASYNAGTGVMTLTSAGGTATLAQWQAALRAITYTNSSDLPNTATRTIGFLVNDGTVDSAVATRAVSVTSVNDAPTETLPGGQTLNQDATLTFSAGNGNTLSITDLDANGGAEQVTLTVTQGTLTLGGTTGLVFSVGSGSGDATMTFTGTVADINAALAGMVYAPTAGYHGSDTLTLAVNDQGNSGSGGAQSATGTVALTVSPINPTVTVVSSTTADGVYKVGDTITETITFDQVVTVNSSGGAPTLLLDTGGTDHLATYVSGSGTNTLTFTYTVQAGDQSADLDYASTGALVLNGATIRNGNGDDALLALPSPGSAGSLAGQKALVVDGVAPTVSSVAVPANGTYVAGQNLDFTVNFSEVVTVDTSGGTPRLAVTLDTGGTVYADYVSGSGSTALVFRLTVAAGQNDANGIVLGSAIDTHGGSLRDAAGNSAVTGLNSVASTAHVDVDAVAPTVTSVGVPAPGAYSAGQTLTFTVNYSEAVTVDTSGGTPRLAVTLDTGGTVYADYVGGSGGTTLTFALTVAAGQNDADGIAVGAALDAHGATIRDAAGNDASLGLHGVGATTGVLVDTAAPAVTAVGVPAAGDYRAGQVLTFTLDTTENVVVDTSGGTPRLALDIGGSTVYANYVSGSGTGQLVFQYTVRAGDTDANGIGITGLQANGGVLRDAAGNALSTALSGVGSTAGVLVDTAAPTPAGIVRADPSPANASGVDYTVTFSEDVSGVDVADFTLAATGSAAGTVTSVTRVDGHTYTVHVGGVAGTGTLALGLSASGTGIVDGAGNALSGGLTGAAYAVDRDAPAVRSVGLPANGTYVAGQTMTFTVDYSEAVTVDTSGGTPRLAVTLDTGGTVYADYVGGSGTATLTFQLTVAAGQADPNGIQVAPAIDPHGATLRDAAGNSASLALSGLPSAAGIQVDAVPPTIEMLAPVGASPTSAPSVSFTVTFSEAVSGVDAADFVLVLTGTATGRVTSVTAVDGQHYTVVVDGVGGTGTLALQLAGAGAGIADSAGNALAGATATSAAYTVRPANVVPPPVSPPAPVSLPPSVPYVEAPSTPVQTFDPGVTLGTGRGGTPVLDTVSVSVPAPGAMGGAGDAAGTTGAGAIVPLDSRPISPDPLSGTLGPRPAAPGAPGVGATASPATEGGLGTTPDIGRFTARPGQPLNIGLPAALVPVGADRDGGVTVEIRQADGRPLPSWLRYDPVTGALVGRPPAGVQGHYSLQIVVTDARGHRVTTHMEIDVRSAPAPAPDRTPGAAPGTGATHDGALARPLDLAAALGRPALPAREADSATAAPARPGLAAQFAQHGHAARAAERAALLQQLQAAGTSPRS